jgi:VIT1/CCC1 family predicted Fe2+/Mn2+ transporter
MPLVPYLAGMVGEGAFTWSAVVTFATLFGVGATRTAVTVDRWWWAGLEMLVLGLVVAAAAYVAGAVIAAVLA